MACCPKCNEVRESGIMFCPACGVELIMDPTCPKCGNKFEDGTKSCKLDGTNLVAANKLIPTCPKCGRKFEDGTEFCPEDGGEVLPETLIEEEMQKTGAMPLFQEGLAQTKFSLLPDEKIIIEGRFTYYYKFNSLVKGGTTYLTQFRLVFCNNHSILFPALFAVVGGFLTTISGYKSELWFLLYYLVAYAICIARKATKITFQIPISQIRSINRKKYGFGSKYTVLTDAGVQYVVQFIKENKWKSALRSLGINIQSLTKEGKPVD